MLIILEGADGSGKTTLLKKFLDKGFICKRNLRGEKPNWDALRYDALDQDIVVDRSFISDMVYRTVQGGPAEDIMLRDAIYYLTKYTIVVYCKTIKMFETSMERGEDNITNPKTAKCISKTYDTLLTFLEKFTDIKVLKYNFRNVDCFKTLLKNIDKRKEEVLNGV